MEGGRQRCVARAAAEDRARRNRSPLAFPSRGQPSLTDMDACSRCQLASGQRTTKEQIWLLKT